MSDKSTNGAGTAGQSKPPTAAISAPATVIPPAGPGTPAANFDKRTACPVTRAQFEARSPGSVEVRIGDRVFAANRKHFSTGSFGYHLGDKLTVTIDGKECKLQLNVTMTVVGSKDAK